MQQRFDVLSRRIRTESPDAGTRAAVADVAGKPLRAWDSRSHTLRPKYDLLQRPTHQYVRDGSATERLLLRSVYGEALDTTSPPTAPPASTAQAANLRGKAYQIYDCAGLVTNAQFDFKGNLLTSDRRLAVAYQTEPDWLNAQNETVPASILAAVASSLETETFHTESTYDALSRITSHTTPDGSVSIPRYNEANLLEAVHVRVRGGAERSVISNLDYNARGQRILCQYANPESDPSADTVRIEYDYDPKTFRLAELRSFRGSVKLQHLVYTYDPVGNIVALRDRADTAPLFNTTPVSGDGLYVYDALYRLIQATGREFPGGQPIDTDPAPTTGIPHANDTQALLAYVESYAYDQVGNIKQIAHTAGTSNSAGWTRNYQYAATSNRLTATSIPGSSSNLSDTYGYDAHGSMTSVPHLAVMEWDYADRLKHTRPLATGTDQNTYFTYDAGGQRVRKVFESVAGGLTKERIYLGDYEIYRERTTPGGSVSLERQTLHLTDDSRRVAMAETKTVDSGAPPATVTTLWRFQLDNHLGSALLELDEAGNVITYEEYHPYGSTAFSAAKAGVEVPAKRYRYTGKERDDETGFYYHGARYYAPWLGRWTAADPAGMVEGTNLYAYSRGNPITRHDPGGTKSTELVNPQIVKQARFTGKETQAQIRAQYAETGIEYSGKATWNKRTHSWFVDRSQLKKPVEEVTFEDDVVTPDRPAKAGSGAGTSAGDKPQGDRAATTGEALTAFGKGAAKGAVFAIGLVALGSVGTVIGAGLLAYGAYKLATGGYKDVAASVERLATGKGTAADFEGLGGVVGGALGGGAAGLARGAAAGGRGAAAGELGAAAEGSGAGAEGGGAAAGAGEGLASGEAGATGGGGQKLLALGRNRNDLGEPLLKPFAERIGAKRVLDLHTPKGMDLPQEIAFRMEGADQIHFNLAEMGDLSSVLSEGRSFYPGSNARFTSWEFSQVIDNPALRGKAFFHTQDGTVVPGFQFKF